MKLNINRTVFFAEIRKAPFGGRLSTAQVEGVTAILDAWEASGTLSDIRWLAYMFATVFRETGATMQPVRETFATSDDQAIARLDAAWKAGKLPQVSKPYWRKNAKGLAYFGRGLPQITHEDNYRKMGQILGIPLVTQPELALDMDTAIDIMFEGMTRGLSSKGDFTGKSLEDYFNKNADDPVKARRIINGNDHADLIAGYYRNFLAAIKLGQENYIPGLTTDYIPPETDKKDAQPDDVPAGKSRSLWAIFLGLFGAGGVSISDVFSGGSTLFSSIGNLWALLAFVTVLGAAGVLGWLIWTGRLQILRSKAVK